MDAQPYLLDNFTITLPLTEELYCTVYHDQETGFRLVLVRIGTSQLPYRLAEAADWEQFYGKVPALLKDTERWEEEKEVKQNDTLSSESGGIYL